MLRRFAHEKSLAGARLWMTQKRQCCELAGLLTLLNWAST